jgi:hypothetical protein
MSHAITRTSPKGPGQKFVGRCAKCGREGLAVSAALEDCPADMLLSDEGALLEILATPGDQGGEGGGDE